MGLPTNKINREIAVYEKTLKSLQEKIRTRKYVMTVHAEEEMDDDELSIFDVERAVLTGKIIARQEDHETSEWKYIISGETIHGFLLIVVAKLSVTNKLVIITVFLE